jgi:xanthine dehydrogenase accessory factor
MPLMSGSLATFHLYAQLPLLLNSRDKFALATITGTKGSAPQKQGNSAVFGQNGLIAGTIGGGIVEYTVKQRAADAITRNRSELHTFSLNHEFSDKNGAICGGTMSILLDATPEQHLTVFDAIKTSLSQRTSGVMVTSISNDITGRLLIRRNWITSRNFEEMKIALDPEIVYQVLDMLNNPVMGDFKMTGSLKAAAEENQTVFMETVIPPPRLVIAGAGHVGKALSHLGKLLGFEVIVWDFRSEYATMENLPDADIILSGSISTSLAKITVDKNTYIVAVTTGHKNDADVLKTFIGSGAGYIGMIGSRKKTVVMREHFLEEGWATSGQWDKIFTPVGLAINSETVEEIAVSIAAQLIQVRHHLNRKQ